MVNNQAINQVSPNVNQQRFFENLNPIDQTRIIHKFLNKTKNVYPSQIVFGNKDDDEIKIRQKHLNNHGLKFLNYTNLFNIF